MGLSDKPFAKFPHLPHPHVNYRAAAYTCQPRPPVQHFGNVENYFGRFGAGAPIS